MDTFKTSKIREYNLMDALNGTDIECAAVEYNNSNYGGACLRLRFSGTNHSKFKAYDDQFGMRSLYIPLVSYTRIFGVIPKSMMPFIKVVDFHTDVFEDGEKYNEAEYTKAVVDIRAWKKAVGTPVYLVLEPDPINKAISTMHYYADRGVALKKAKEWKSTCTKKWAFNDAIFVEK